MKTLFSAHRLIRTFALYVVIIVIPLGIMFYYGSRSLSNQREQIEQNVVDGLRSVGDNFNRELGIGWQKFLQVEQVRKYYDYQPLVIPDESRFASAEMGVSRSELYHKIDQLKLLGADVHAIQDLTLSNAENLRGTNSVKDIIDHSLIGYFQFDPSTHQFVTPYDPTQAFDSNMHDEVEAFRSYLRKQLKPRLLDSLGLSEDVRPFVPLAVLRHLKSSHVTKEREPRSKVNKLQELMQQPVSLGNELVSVIYYDFNFLRVTSGDLTFLVGFRPTMVDNQLLVQGFLINTVLFMQEAQVYLEKDQPQYGSVVFTPTDKAMPARPIFEPFNFLSMSYRIGAEDEFLGSYFEERRRFIITMLGLTIALVISMIHLGTLLWGHVDLHRKKNNFISAITHELKAPLTSVMMYAEMLEEGWARGKEQKYYAHIRMESERLSRLIRNILDFSGLERGTFKLQPSVVQLDSFVGDTVASLSDWADKEGLELDLQILAEPQVYADPDSLSQVVYNLCDNTIKYGMGNDQPKLVIKVTELEENAILVFYDNGDGVPKEEEDKVFQRFYRIESEMTRESTGTGLGLALVKDLVEGNRGTIEYFRPEGGGFGMEINFPRHGVEDDDLDDLDDETRRILEEQEFA